MKKLILLIFTSLCLTAIYGKGVQEDGKVVLSGHIRDKSNGEELIGANIYLKDKPVGTSTNVYGFYSISLEKDEYTIVFSYLGYHSLEKTVNLKNDLTLNIELVPEDRKLEEIVVTAEKPDKNITRDQMSFEKLEMKQVKEMPSFMGETDIIKSVQLLPGVQSLSEGSSGYSVRGGSQDQNLVLLDEATVYNISHMMGFFSVFNNDAIQNAELYKGDIPARFGSRLSSVLDIRMKNGNSKNFSVTGGIGSISSRLTLEGPIIKDRSSFIVSGRRTYFDMFFPLLPEDQVQGSKLYFYDLNTKINHRINENNRIFLSGYFGRDKFNNAFADFGYGNQTATFRWNHLYSKKIFSNLTILYSNYNYFLASPEDIAASMKWDSRLEDYAVKMDFTYYPNPKNTMTFGVSSSYHIYDPGKITGTGENSMFETFKIPSNTALEHGLYFSNNQELWNNKVALKYGLRLSVFQNIGDSDVYSYDNNYEVSDTTNYQKGEIYNTYLGLEPRIGVKYKINYHSSIKASYSRTRQNVQMAQNSRAGTPLDIWFPATPNVKPQISDQYALGYFRNFFNNKLETSVEGYYKNMNNTIDFKDHAWLLMNPYMEGELRFGKGRAYGVELLAKLKNEKINGWVSYTYSHAERKIETIRDGQYYPAPHDRPHDISFVLSYNLNSRMTFSSNWVYSSGQPVTFPTGRLESEGLVVPVYSERNAYRLPDYHRLDLAFTIRSKKKPGRSWEGEWNFSVYNAYGRKNTWAINFIQDEENPDVTYAEKTYLFSVIPSITYNFKF